MCHGLLDLLPQCVQSPQKHLTESQNIGSEGTSGDDLVRPPSHLVQSPDHLVQPQLQAPNLPQPTWRRRTHGGIPRSRPTLSPSCSRVSSLEKSSLSLLHR